MCDGDGLRIFLLGGSFDATVVPSVPPPSIVFLEGDEVEFSSSFLRFVPATATVLLVCCCDACLLSGRAGRRTRLVATEFSMLRTVGVMLGVFRSNGNGRSVSSRGWMFPGVVLRLISPDYRPVILYSGDISVGGGVNDSFSVT